MSACLANGLAVVFSVILNLVQIIVFASIIVSWVGDPSNRMVQMIYSMSEPIYKPFRGLTSKLGGPIDWTPLIVLLLIFFIKNSFLQMLFGMGVACKQPVF